MRESISMVSLLNFVIFFIFLVFAFLMGTFSYYKAYRVNNDIVKAIEKFEGYNDLSKNEIKDKLGNLGYQPIEFTCPDRGSDHPLRAGKSKTGTVNGGINYYCVYYNDDTYEKSDATHVNKTDPYYSYEVTTLITFKFPVIESLLKIRVSAKTRRMYDFELASEVR